jgi:hypothetical protein
MEEFFRGVSMFVFGWLLRGWIGPRVRRPTVKEILQEWEDSDKGPKPLP